MKIRLLLTCLAFISALSGCKQEAGKTNVESKVAIIAQKQGWMKKDDYRRVRSISDDIIAKKRKATEDEVLYALSVSEQAKGTIVASTEGNNYYETGFIMQKSGDLTPETRKKVSDFAMDLTKYQCNKATPECSDGLAAYGVHKQGVILLGVVGVPSDIPMLEKLSNHPFLRVREEAEIAIDKIRSRHGSSNKKTDLVLRRC